MNQIKIFTDGGSRGNPGPAACAFVVLESDKIIFERGFYLGNTTNNVAEYSGVLNAMDWCSVHGTQYSVSFYLDSELVVKQMRGEYKIKDEKLKTLYNKIQFQISNYKFQIAWNHVPREQNTRADSLVNRELDRHG